MGSCPSREGQGNSPRTLISIRKTRNTRQPSGILAAGRIGAAGTELQGRRLTLYPSSEGYKQGGHYEDFQVFLPLVPCGVAGSP